MTNPLEPVLGPFNTADITMMAIAVAAFIAFVVHNMMKPPRPPAVPTEGVFSHPHNQAISQLGRAWVDEHKGFVVN
jgi:hypothetical protein